MRSPSGWAEPGQRPEFDEFTVVLRGALLVEYDGGQLTVQAGQAVHTAPGEWVRYSSPGPSGAEYVAVCLPAFTPGTVHRVRALEDTLIVEVSTPDIDDVVRLADDYGREGTSEP